MYILPDRARRERGAFSVVQLQWEILDPKTKQRVEDGLDFESATGFTEFPDGVPETDVEIQPKADLIPEFSETFIIRLYAVTGQ